MTTTRRPTWITTDQVARLLAGLPPKVVADIMNHWIIVPEDPDASGYTDQQAEQVRLIFDRLTDLRPDAVDLATNS